MLYIEPKSHRTQEHVLTRPYTAATAKILPTTTQSKKDNSPTSAHNRKFCGDADAKQIREFPLLPPRLNPITRCLLFLRATGVASPDIERF